ncbi:MAG: bifunctional UDP-3-O-[3-hydroxymyristoyl] N-acetylglucosamine deacetylase/3-hydroxyacyl-ACP dehydratase [Prolixibacteraceae bacterium]|nr:bifunctional UDP-3-O-[3-hydroxymyristoyl] N-acetylglucosamine deacetylase/3-hydroxyacyl-ACP dehydratase [Prolixibacteraceae bacterium]MBN2648184.1 bifunctional UDP-3-O-[3-hydroxymyristoyl] N-acetylglucosamine deacetylase/3-hydroxyacyl-ACP dehydratase [Prolixibacteraceae bacterium]
MVTKQKTILNEVTLTGKGLHTGLSVNMTIKPAAENTGIVFRRIDLDEKTEIKADVSNVVDTSRGTVIETDGARVSTIEHTLAALSALEIDNALIEIDAPETPILDGSSKVIVDAIGDNNTTELDAEREYFKIRKKIVFKDEKSGAELMALPDDEYSIDVMISFDSPVLHNQYARLNSLKDFKTEIAPCRTFVFLHELEFLLNNNLVKGGDLDNAIVIMDRDVNQHELDRIADLFHHEHIKLNGNKGILNNLKLHFDNEPARHKLLDVVGDLTLLGKPIKGKIIATRPGHSSNVQFAKLLQKEMNKQFAKTAAPIYDCNKESLLDVQKIKELLPHRYPFLMVDKIIDIKEKHIIGVKNITTNEPIFTGHFPSEPVFPGVLQIEAMAQVGGLYVLNQLDPTKNYSTYFMKIDGIKFRQKVVPGDTLIIKVELLTPIRRGIATMKGYAFVGNQLVSEGEFMAQIVENK